MKKSFESLRCLIFDLDDTLADTHGQLIMPALHDSFSAMIESGLNADLAECKEQYEYHREHDPRSSLFEKLIARFGTRDGAPSGDIAKLGSSKFYDRPVPGDFQPFGATTKILSQLRRKYSLFLVTAGVPSTQQQKVSILGLASFFTHIFYVDITKNETKGAAFRRILYQQNISAGGCLSIGNRIDKEIAEAKQIGMHTCLVRHGEYISLTPISTYEIPDFTIANISEIIDVCQI